jgi:hypothetical protein
VVALSLCCAVFSTCCRARGEVSELGPGSELVPQPLLPSFGEEALAELASESLVERLPSADVVAVTRGDVPGLGVLMLTVFEEVAAFVGGEGWAASRSILSSRLLHATLGSFVVVRAFLRSWHRARHTLFMFR